MLKSTHSKSLFHVLAIGLNHILPNKFQEIAQEYDHYVSFSSLINGIYRYRYFHVFLISQQQKNYLTILKNVKIEFPNSIFVVLSENLDCIQELIEENVLFMILDRSNDRSTENSLHQLWRWLLVMGYQKLGVDNSKISIAGGSLSLFQETYEKNNKVYKLTRKQMDIMKILLEYRGEIVSRMMILERAWADDKKVVTDRVIDTNIVALRKMLDDNGRNPMYLQTIFGQGYRLTCE